MNLPKSSARQAPQLAPTAPPFFPMKEEVRTAIGLRKAQRSHRHASIYPRVTGSLEGPLALKTGTSTSLGYLLLEQKSPSRGQVSIL